MYKLNNGQVVSISLTALVFAFFFKSLYWGFRISVFLAVIAAVWNSHLALTEAADKVKNAYLSIKSWFYDEHIDLASVLKRLNTKPDAIKNFRLNHKAVFKLPVSRRTLLSVLNDKDDMSKPCHDSVKAIIGSIESELVSLDSKLTIGKSIAKHLEAVLDNLTGCEFAISILADLIQSIDVAVQDHLQAYSNDLSGMSLIELCSRIGITI
jgi:hypothetical protein